MYFFILLVIAFSAYVAFAVQKQRRHLALMKHVPFRIHVNGIRGKSSVTRLVAAALREGEIATVAKTTGTAARIITSHTEEEELDRHAPDIAEQRRTLDRLLTERPDTRAVVFECMAINPLYQRYLETKIMRSTIGIITNVREDHMDDLGHTLPDIARSLSATVPTEGHLVTAEDNPELIDVLREVCDERGTVLHLARRNQVTTAEIERFRHFEFKENVAIALRIARLAGVPRDVAMRGMTQALPDPGAFQIQTLIYRGRKVHWINLFAVNDRESFGHTVALIRDQVGADLPLGIVLNNREDRPERVAQFTDIAATDVGAQFVAAFGAYENRVEAQLRRLGEGAPQLVKLGNTSDFRDADGEALLDEILTASQAEEVILIGAVNIHTDQATALLAGFDRLAQLEGEHVP